MREHKTFERESPQCAYMGGYIDFSLELVACTEPGGNIASECSRHDETQSHKDTFINKIIRKETTDDFGLCFSFNLQAKYLFVSQKYIHSHVFFAIVSLSGRHISRQ